MTCFPFFKFFNPFSMKQKEWTNLYRTYEELKQISLSVRFGMTPYLYRTYEELKRVAPDLILMPTPIVCIYL